MSRRLIAMLSVVLGALFVPSVAQGAFGIEEWEAVTCKENKDTPALGGPPVVGAYPLAEDPLQCNKDTPERWYTQAAGHPNFGVTEFVLENTAGFPEGFVKKIVVDIPEGLTVNPEATPQCALSVAETNILACPQTTIVGVNYLTVATAAPGVVARAASPVYNVEPFFGVPSMVAFPDAAGEAVYIVGALDPVDQHVSFTIDPVHAPDAGPPPHPPILGSRLVFNGRAGDGTYLTMPSNCGEGQTSTIFVESHGPPFGPAVFTDEASFTTAVGASGCELVPFNPTINAGPQGRFVDSPEATNVEVGIPFSPNAPIANSYLKEAEVILPEGTGLNPASANGLVACQDEQFAMGTNTPIACPEESRVGSVEVQTPSLPEDSLFGAVYIGQPLSGDPMSGNLYRIFLHVGSARYGVNVRLEGKVFANPDTGQVTAVVKDNPQATFRTFKVRLEGGPKGVLTTPPTCGPHTTNTRLTPWSGTADATPSSSFMLPLDPKGGPCPATLGERTFAPTYTSRSDTNKANAYTPFRVHLSRSDGEQELKVIDVKLPRGLSGKVAGIPYCPEAAMDAAAASTGAAERANPSCPADSRIASTITAAGSGSNPIEVGGHAYLAGPYKGAPLSMVVITPAVAGPYDLGTVVIRIALYVDPETAQINAQSDVIPHLLSGAKLDIQGIDVYVDRAGFMHNPTNCKTNAVTGQILGGGSNPSDRAAFSSYPVNDAYAAADCDRLKFKPKLKVKIRSGKKSTKRRGHPALQAVLTAKDTEANMAYTALTLPKSMLLDNSHFKTICTRVQLNAGACPSGARYGKATAKSPLLAEPLRGPVYLVSSDDKLPNLVADLRGQVNVRLRGVITTKKGAMRTTFPNVPDVPVSKFVLRMSGGAKGLIVNSTDLCKSSRRGRLVMKGQNGKRVKIKNYAIQAPCGKKKNKK
jgi:hypothetical protein